MGILRHSSNWITYLLRRLDIRSYEQALDQNGRYYPFERYPQKTLHALAELLPHSERAQRGLQLS